MRWRALIGAAVLASPAASWYVPGVTPVEYSHRQAVAIKVNSASSTKTAIPYDYYDLPVCLPKNRVPTAQVENFGEILWGDIIKPSLYLAYMNVNQTCSRVCTKRYDAKEKQLLRKRVEESYRGHFILDNLPVSEIFPHTSLGGPAFQLGYPLGTPARKGDARLAPIKSTTVNNHLAFTIKYHTPDDEKAAQNGFRIVGFHITAHSVKHAETECLADTSSKWYPDPRKGTVSPDDDEITWSYSVNWVEDTETNWASRWDVYLNSSPSDHRIHTWAVFNSMVVLLFLTGLVAFIMIRALHKDFTRYNDRENPDDTQEETGWKLVHADVFRPPPYPGLLSACIGTGSQLISLTVLLIVFSLAGFLSPANRGGLLTTSLLLFIILGCYGGFVTARLLKMFKAQSWFNVFLMSSMFPGQVFCVFIFMDLVLWGMHAATAVPFGTIIALGALWLVVSNTLCVAGAVLGYKRAAPASPCEVSPVERGIPEQKWYMSTAVTVLMAGILPFGAAFMELFFILSSLWGNRYYYVFGYLALVSVILFITCAEISIVMIYFQLCYEDHRWWWRAFWTSGSAGIHLFLYSIFYFFTTLKITKIWSAVLYFGWMAIVSYAFALICGTIGFLATFAFVRRIYSSIKVA